MSKCLVRKMQSTVNAPLPYLMEIRFAVDNPETKWAEIRTSDSQNIYALNSGNVYANGLGVFTEENDIFVVKDKYKITSINANNLYFDISNLKNVTPLRYLQSTNSKTYGDISSLANLNNLQTISLSGSVIEGNINNLLGMSSLTSIILEQCKKISGNISFINALPSINNIRLYNCSNITGDIQEITNTTFTTLTCANTSTYGTIESLVRSQRDNGRTSASSITVAFGSRTTFNGNPISFGDKSLSWTENTITFDGTTIDA